MASFQAKNRLEKAEREKKLKIIVPFRSVPSQRVLENSKNIAKKFEKLNNTVTASFRAKIGWKRPRKRKNKNYRSVPFRSNPTHNTKFQKNSKKIKILKIPLWLYFKPK